MELTTQQLSATTWYIVYDEKTHGADFTSITSVLPDPIPSGFAYVESKERPVGVWNPATLVFDQVHVVDDPKVIVEFTLLDWQAIKSQMPNAKVLSDDAVKIQMSAAVEITP